MNNLKRFFPALSLLVLLLPQAYSGEKQEISSISFGPVVLGENRVPIDLEKFKIKVNVPGLKVSASFLPETFQWVRVEEVLLVPRVRIGIEFFHQAKDLSLSYHGNSILTQSIEPEKSYSEFYVSLFYPQSISLYLKGKKKGEISIEVPILEKDKQEGQLIDYSCAPFNLEITGLEGEFYSAGCHLVRKGGMGNETAVLEVSWVTPHFKLLEGSNPPYLATLNKNFPVEVTLQNKSGERRVVRIRAKVPEKMPRLKTALGFGPYVFETENGRSSSGWEWTSPLMLYANFYLTENTSLRGFDAFVYTGSLFNNLGLYFAYDVGSALDNRFKIIPLLGLQGITFRHEKSGETISEAIYPQGFEVSYYHAFGFKNHTLVYGMFFSPRTDENYKNIWLRYGKRVFWEINFLSWAQDDNYARTWGLSVGIPFVTLF